MLIVDFNAGNLACPLPELFLGVLIAVFLHHRIELFRDLAGGLQKITRPFLAEAESLVEGNHSAPEHLLAFDVCGQRDRLILHRHAERLLPDPALRQHVGMGLAPLLLPRLRPSLFTIHVFTSFPCSGSWVRASRIPPIVGAATPPPAVLNGAG